MVRRALMTPVAVAAAAVHLATLPAGGGWTHDFGQGGIFGDTILGALLNALPLPFETGVPFLGVLSLAAAVWLALHVTGFDRGELRRMARFGTVCVILCYDQLMRLMGRLGAATATGAAAAACGAAERHAARRAERREAALSAGSDEDGPEPAPEDDRGALSGLTEFVRRAVPRPAAAAAPGAPAGDVVAPAAPGDAPPFEDGALIEDDGAPAPAPIPAPPLEDRVKARIGQAIKSRVRQPIVLGARPEPRLTASAPAPARAIPAAPGPAPEREEDAGNIFGDLGPEMPADAPERPARPAAFVRSSETAPRVAQPAPAPRPSARAKAEAQPALALEPAEEAGFETPPLALLRDPSTVTRHVLSEEALEENARMLESVLDDYGVKGEIVSVRPGPVVTMYELEPAPGLKASRVIGLADDIARSMSALAARVSTVPGRSVIGIELPNANREMCVLREILAARDYGDSAMRLPLALGKDIGGEPVVANLAKMPHLLIAGTTGSGKSVAINTMILSLLYRLTPEECRLIMIDPKMLELSVYDGIPHLLSPVVTDPKKAVTALKWVVGEMEDRYRKMSKMGVRNIEGYNGRVRETLAKGEMFERTVQTGFDEETGDPVFETEVVEPKTLPYIVVIVDEMADLMMVAGKEIEACIQRLAQMARASGIHLIMATQRPSVDVITGTIKANFPTRISFQVTSKIDSRTILGEMGAEQLLGQGDMLYMAGGGKITRVHGPFCSDEEVEEIVTFLKQFGPPEYVGGVQDGPDESAAEGGATSIDEVLGLGNSENAEDRLYDEAVQIAVRDRKASTSYIQRKLGIGYNKAARLVERMEDEGVVSASNHVGKREVLVPEPH
ncbi:MAG: DNA translocase FtsK [Hasllibacter sp.]